MRSKNYDFSIKTLLERIRALPLGEVKLMEVCGTHTMAIAKSGLRSVLPENIHLISGPGCPVCVTPSEVMDAVLHLSEEKNIIIASYGDMIRVPGSHPGDNLIQRRAKGAMVEVVYSPMDALKIASENPDFQVVFLGVGFETTAPGTAATIVEAAERGVDNFSVFPMLKRVEPALRALLAEKDFDINGFICPGHVATIVGEAGLRFLPEEYGMPAVISGFEPEDILMCIYRLLRQIESKKPALENGYKRAVAPEGNTLARKMIDLCFEAGDDHWRGMGMIPKSGFQLRRKYEYLDARKRFGIHIPNQNITSACRCGDVIRGKIAPGACPLFGKVCLPEDPVGPCMVSSEGACAAAYKYREVDAWKA